MIPVLIFACGIFLQPVQNYSETTTNKQTTYFELLRLYSSGHRRNQLTDEQVQRLGFIGTERKRIWDEADQLIEAKKYNLAVAKYKEMFQYEPAYTEVYSEMGDVRYVESNIAAAIDFYHQGQEHVDDVPGSVSRFLTPWVRLGDLAAARGNYREAASLFRQVIYRDKKQDWTLPNGKSIKENIFPANSRVVRGVLSSDSAILARCALYLYRSGEQREALNVYQIALKKYSNSENSNTLVDGSDNSLMRDLTPKNAKSVAWSEILAQPKTAEALDENTFESACYTMMALTIGNSSWIDDSGKLWKQDKEAALVAAQKATTLAPRYAPAQLVLGLAYEKCGQPDKAEAAFNEATLFDAPSVRDLAEFRRKHLHR